MNTTLLTLVPLLLSPNGQNVTIRVDLSALPDSADDDIERWIIEDATKTLRAHGHSITENADTTVKVAVSWYGDNDVNTLVTLGLNEEDPVEVRCPACGDEQWLAKLDAEMETLAENLGDERVEPPTKTPPPPVQDPADGPSTQETTPAKKKAPWLSIGGASLVGGGTGLAIAGAFDLAKGRQRAKSTESRQERTTTNYTPRGTAFVVVGSAAVAGGVTMLILDAIRRKKRRETTLRPALGSSWTGLILQGEF